MNAADEREELPTMSEAFERVPDVCVVMVNFNGDVHKDCGELPTLVRDKLCDKVVLIVNKVDHVMHGPEKTSVSAEYSPEKMKELGEAYLRNSASDDVVVEVIFTCLRSNGLFPEERVCLQAREILFAEDVVLHRIKKLANENSFSIRTI
ncbi:hypothetical protein R1flu_004319 [Riccia fluitans]|uniref:Uncharacterized protein n=1 Tax=Riccia fluitans TaxID=41844 RepID=A0ABD1YPX8_9MARC